MTGAQRGADALRRVVLATGNAGKVRELEALLGAGWQVVPQSALGVEPAAETGCTFLDNALLKARHAAVCTGLPAIADDSGLEVDALGGAPGVYSARFAGEGASDADNVALLLARLEAVATRRRTARFRCVMVYLAGPRDGAPLVAEGCWDGHIAAEPRGAGGFGYDPVFVDPASGLTAAELPPAQKNQRSHRGQACLRLKALIEREELPAI
jgi:XTP/dITP diphosphohydrolase